MDRNDYQKAENYWKIHDENSIKMDRSALLNFAEEFLLEHTTCALATGFNDFVRCTPIEYNWINGSFYFISEGGMKFKALAENKEVCLAIFETFKDFGNIAGMQVTGKAEIIEFGTKEYSMVLAYKRIPESAILKLTHPMYMIKVVPEDMELLFSEFKKMGFDSRQMISF